MDTLVVFIFVFFATPLHVHVTTYWFFETIKWFINYLESIFFKWIYIKVGLISNVHVFVFGHNTTSVPQYQTLIVIFWIYIKCNSTQQQQQKTTSFCNSSNNFWTKCSLLTIPYKAKTINFCVWRQRAPRLEHDFS